MWRGCGEGLMGEDEKRVCGEEEERVCGEDVERG